MRVIQIGNFGPEHSTERHLRRALMHNGHDVLMMQEDDPNTFLNMSNRESWPTKPDFILWTRTGWDWDNLFAGKGSGTRLAHGLQRSMLQQAERLGVPVVGYHLDLWFGLNREHQLAEPFFECPLVITADGGHQAEFAARGINHEWMPPAVSLAECEPGTPRDEFRSKLAFVGSWQGSYHKEHQHRFELVQWLQRNFRRDCEFYPRIGEHAIRGEALRDLYASVDVVVGDSCLAGTGITNYWSDRIPETVGRGGLLLHPSVPGIVPHFIDGEHLILWEAGNWDELGDTIEYALSHPEENRAIAAAGREHVLKHHTYETRVGQLVERLKELEML